MSCPNPCTDPFRRDRDTIGMLYAAAKLACASSGSAAVAARLTAIITRLEESIEAHEREWERFHALTR